VHVGVGVHAYGDSYLSLLDHRCHTHPDLRRIVCGAAASGNAGRTPVGRVGLLSGHIDPGRRRHGDVLPPVDVSL